MLHMTLMIWSVLCASLLTSVFGSPLSQRALGTGNDNSNNDNGASRTYIIAGVVVGVIVFLAAIIISVRYNKKRDAAARQRAAVNPVQAILNAGQSSATLTSQNGSSTTPSTTGAAPTARSNRPRRTRRTPSQISTKSLPAYMEEPGDQELVLVRRAMDTQEEEGEDDTSNNTLVADSGPRYSHEAQSSVELNAVTTPLLDTTFESRQDPPEHPINPPLTVPPQPSHRPQLSFDSIGSGSADTHTSGGSGTELLGHRPTMSVSSEPDPRGEAPPYFEHVTPEGPTPEPSPVPSEPSPPPPTANIPTNGENLPSVTPTSPTGHRIMPKPFRRLFGTSLRHRPDSGTLADVSSPPPEGSSGRTRADTAATIPDSGSLPSILLSRSRSPSRLGGFGAALTRPLTNTSSASNISLIHQRNRSGSSLNPSDPMYGLSSPSTTSLNSLLISSPLSHTATRTDFTFPKAGPTAEQLKFVSSRESLGRFGVPFGADARAAARDLREDPPPFPAEDTPERGSESSNTEAGPSSATPTTPSASTSGASRGPPSPWWAKLTQPAGPSSPPPPEEENPSSIEPASIEAEPVRSASRADTLGSTLSERTFATAAESVASSVSLSASTVSDSADDDEFEDAPATPIARRTSLPSSIRTTTSLVVPNDLHDQSEAPHTPESGLAFNIIPATPSTPVGAR